MARKLIFTQSSGFVYSQYTEYTVPLMKRYAEKIGADLLHDHLDKKPKYPLFGKFKVGDLLGEWDRVLFLDCDILVRPDSPDIFGIVPEGRFAALNEGSWCGSGDIEPRRDLLDKAATAFGISTTDFDMTTGYFNGGVFMADRVHKDLFDMPSDNKFMEEVTAEQNVINLRLAQKGHKTYSLPLCFNAMPWRWSTHYIDDNYFIHYAGMKPAMRMHFIEDGYRHIMANYILP